MKYYLKWAPVYATYLTIFGLAAFEKWSNPGVPPWFISKFEKTILNPFSGALGAQFYLIATFETLITLGFLLSLIRGELRPQSHKTYLKLSLWGSSALFAMLSFGLRLTQDFATGSQVFIFFIASFGLLLFLENKTESENKKGIQ